MPTSPGTTSGRKRPLCGRTVASACTTFSTSRTRFGLVYLRVPTWAPFRLQFYFNGHSWLAHKLTAKGIGYTMADNAFVRIDDWVRRGTG